MMTDQKCVWIDLCSRLRGSNKNLEGAFGMHNLISPTFLLLQKIPQQAAKKVSDWIHYAIPMGTNYRPRFSKTFFPRTH